MTVLVLAWVSGCDPGAPPRGEPPGAPATVPHDAPAGESPARAGPPGDAPGPTGATRSVEIMLEPGRISADGWVSAPAGRDRLVAPPAIGEAPDDSGARRWRAALPPGPGVARIERDGCSAVEVPYLVGPVPVLVLPYPACDAPDAPALPSGARLDRAELPWAAVEVLHGLELFTDVPAPAPGEEDGPARWIALEEARAICAWRGGRLPTKAEWEAARAGATGVPAANATRDRLGSGAVGAAARALAGLAPYEGPAGHLDLDGNVEEWLADGTVAGGSWVSLPEELGVTRAVPPNARTDTIGVRCAYGP